MTEIKFPDFSKARVGDKVWSVATGWGEISQIKANNLRFPISVHFPAVKITKSFLTDGRRCGLDLFPELYFDEIRIDVPESSLKPPKRKKTRWFYVYRSPISGGFYPSAICNTYGEARQYMTIGGNLEYKQGPFSIEIEVEDD